MTPKENLFRAIRRDNPQWVPNGLEGVVSVEPPLIERPAADGLDPFGVHWSFEPDAEGGTFPTHGRQPVTDVRRWREQVRIPAVTGLDWSGVARRVAEIDRPTQVLSAFIHMGLFERSYLLLGMEEALMAYMDQPESMADLLNALADYKIGLIREFHARFRPEIVAYGDDWGTQTQLFLPPDVWRRIVMPPTKRIYDCIHELGMLVNQHSCGRIEAIFPEFCDMGADIWNPCQPCNDLAALKRRFGGRICFCGGIDSQFVLDRPGASPADVRAEVARRIAEMAPGGGYIAAPSHEVPYDPVLLDAMNEAIREYGRAIYEPS